MISPPDFNRVERAIRYLDEHALLQPRLQKVAREVGLSEFHFQRLFRRSVGVSPKRFLQFLTARRASGLLHSQPTLGVSQELGLSSSSRLHDLLVAVNAVTPGEMKSGGAELEIRWGVHPTPFGDCLIGSTERGICELSFLGEGGEESVLAELAARWPAAHLVQDPTMTGNLVSRIFAPTTDDTPLTLLLRGTNFQLQVWRALLEIPQGQVTSYGAVARSIGAPSASRAVGGAVGANRIAYLIPCHRVIRGTSAFGHYRWGADRKRAMLEWEGAVDRETVVASPT